MSQRLGRQLLADRETPVRDVMRRLFSSAEIYPEQNFAKNTADYTAYQASRDWNTVQLGTVTFVKRSTGISGIYLRTHSRRAESKGAIDSAVGVGRSTENKCTQPTASY